MKPILNQRVTRNMKINKLSLLVLMGTMLSLCNTPKSESLEKNKYFTTDANELFFQNVRKSSYTVQELKEAGMNIYILKGMEEQKIKPRLVHNWREDRAYLMIEFETPIEVFNDQTRLAFGGGNIDQQVGFCDTLYQLIQKGVELSIKDQSDTTASPLFQNEQELENFRITMLDYYQLTGQNIK
jgi:hypothetical protein